MKILVDLNSNVVFEYGDIKKGIFPEADPNVELWKIENEKGTFYAVASEFTMYEVEEVPENYQNYIYTTDEGFVKFEYPKTKEEIMEDEIKALKEQNEMLTECLMEISEIVYA